METTCLQGALGSRKRSYLAIKDRNERGEYSALVGRRCQKPAHSTACYSLVGLRCESPLQGPRSHLHPHSSPRAHGHQAEQAGMCCRAGSHFQAAVVPVGQRTPVTMKLGPQVPVWVLQPHSTFRSQPKSLLMQAPVCVSIHLSAEQSAPLPQAEG